jgi:putative salt-induced outer membrane protein
MPFFAFLLFALLSTNAFALHPAIAEKMQYKCSAKEPFVQRAILNELKASYPDHIDDITANWANFCEQKSAAVQAKEAQKQATTLAAIPSITGFSGQVEAGFGSQSGNVEATNLNFAAKGEQEMQDWRHHFTGSAFNSKQEGQRINEEYRFGIGSDWKINERDYLYAQADYVSDRFGGFNYRISESIGAGRRWIDDGIFLLDTRLGPGFRHTKFANGDKEDSWIILGQLDAGWVVNDYLELGQDALVEYSPDNTILTTNSFVKSRITESLAFKAGFMLEHVSDVPTGTQKNDTRTTATIVYDY